MDPFLGIEVPPLGPYERKDINKIIDHLKRKHTKKNKKKPDDDKGKEKSLGQHVDIEV